MNRITAGRLFCAIAAACAFTVAGASFMKDWRGATISLLLLGALCLYGVWELHPGGNIKTVIGPGDYLVHAIRPFDGRVMIMATERFSQSSEEFTIYVLSRMLFSSDVRRFAGGSTIMEVRPSAFIKLHRTLAVLSKGDE